MLSIFKKLITKKATAPAPSKPTPYLPPVQKPAAVVCPTPTPVAPIAPVEVTPVAPIAAPKPVVRQLITAEQLKGIFPETPIATLARFVAPINELCNEYEINTKNRIAHFISQVGHESQGFAALKENLNYSTDGLLRVFKKYFATRALAEQYARKPKAIASRVYANRLGNGNEASGDGWKHRGFGAIQLTGKSNQTRFGNALGISVEEAIEYLQTPKGAIHGSVWFWKDNNLNTIADKGEAGVTLMTRRINGGSLGLAERLAKFKKAIKIV